MNFFKSGEQNLHRCFHFYTLYKNKITNVTLRLFGENIFLIIVPVTDWLEISYNVFSGIFVKPPVVMFCE